MSFRMLLEKDFIGRGQEIDALDKISSEAKEGVASGIFISGQYGSGKTELLNQLFNVMFWRQDQVAPFFYALNPAFTSAFDFSTDYLGRFIHQRLAFQKKNASLINEGLSLEDLMHVAEESGAHWAVDIIKNHLRIKASGDTTRIFLSAIRAPHNSYLSTGMPVVVLIDDFQKTREFHGLNDDNKNLWMLFEEQIKSRLTPHIITGCRSTLHKMLFQETSFGKDLELFSLSGLDKNSSMKLLTSLCGHYGITVGRDALLVFADLFRGNPFYIRNFIQTARYSGKNPSEKDLWSIYFKEITAGKIYTYWISRLKSHMPLPEERKAALALLYHLCKDYNGLVRQGGQHAHDLSTAPSSLMSVLSVSRGTLDNILNSFQTAGIVDINFSTFNLTEDGVLIDFIKRLYSREILNEPPDMVEDAFLKEKVTGSETEEIQCVEVSIPASPKAGLIAARTLEQIAKNHNISSEITGDLQIALIELLTCIIGQDNILNENINIRFEPRENTFAVELKTPYWELTPAVLESASWKQLAGNYADDIKFEKIKNGTKITLIKNLNKDFAAT
jgi:hypothetical protein